MDFLYLLALSRVCGRNSFTSWQITHVFLLSTVDSRRVSCDSTRPVEMSIRAALRVMWLYSANTGSSQIAARWQHSLKLWQRNERNIFGKCEIWTGSHVTAASIWSSSKLPLDGSLNTPCARLWIDTMCKLYWSCELNINSFVCHISVLKWLGEISTQVTVGKKTFKVFSCMYVDTFTELTIFQYRSPSSLSSS